MAALFGANQLSELAKAISTESISSHVEVIRRWRDDYHHGTLRRDNETAREQAYNREFFIGILGYTEKPSSPFTFEPKASTDARQIPDARIGTFQPETDSYDTVAVVELKGASVQLDRPQRGEGNLSPVQQGFKYRPLYRGCSFVIVSNFYEFRLYNDNQLDYESWTLDDLADPSDDYRSFKTFYLLLRAENFLRFHGISQTQERLSDIRVAQERIGREFYDQYSKARKSLLNNLLLQNEVLRADPDLWIEKGQKIVDRVVFACFAEDRGLLPDNTLQRIQRDAAHSSLSVWATVRAFFEGIDKGDARLEIPVGYNGGLFARDDVLNDLRVGDNALLAVLGLGSYDFEEDLSVNILGHIFEQSIADLESIREDVASGVDTERIRFSRRRNEGIYYTPESIVRYIVAKTLGTRLAEIEDALKAKHNLHVNLQDATYAKREEDTYLEYRNALESIRVVDPACGSGAFLVAAFDYLLAEHRRVASILGDLYDNEQFVAPILQQNLFGVDLNEESVEITKLSLWLKTATKGSKLTALDGNIKVGNSVKVSDTPGNGERMRWHDEFAEIFADGGFDVVISNPPYIREAVNRAAFDGLRDNLGFQGKMDIWTLFGGLGLDIVKPETGRVGFIAPSNWVTNSGASKIRDRVVNEGRFETFVDFGSRMIFQDAAIQTMIYTLRRTVDNEKYSFPFVRLTSPAASDEDVSRLLAGESDDEFDRYSVTVDRALAAGHTLNMNPSTFDDLFDAITRVGRARLQDDEVAQGIVAPQDFLNRKGAEALGGKVPQGSGIFMLSGAEYRSLNLNDEERQTVRPFFTTEQLHRYYGESTHDQWVIYTNSSHRSAESMTRLPHLRAHLDRFGPIITSSNAPYGLHRARDPRFFTGERIVSLRKAARPTFTYLDFDAYVSQTFFIIKSDRWDMRALTAVLNSTLVAFWLRFRGKMQGDAYQVDKSPLLDVPLVVPADQTELARLTDVLRHDRRSLDTARARVLNSLQGEARSWLLEQGEWWRSSERQLADSLPAYLPAIRRSDVLSLLAASRDEVTRLSQAVDGSEYAVDAVVFELYELKPDQIDMIRAATPRVAMVGRS